MWNLLREVSWVTVLAFAGAVATVVLAFLAPSFVLAAGLVTVALAVLATKD